MITRKKIFTINTLHPRPPIATSKEWWILKFFLRGQNMFQRDVEYIKSSLKSQNMSRQAFTKQRANKKNYN
jgi:hypothetical protein